MAFLFATIPSLVILMFFYLNDKFKEPKLIVFQTFLLGYAISFFLNPFLGFFDRTIENIYQSILHLTYLDFDFILNFVRAAYLEETAKFLILYLFVSRYSQFDEPMDSIVYGVTVSLGFSAMENFDYIIREDQRTVLQIALIRIWPTFMHMTTGVIMGIFFSRYYFNSIPRLWKLFICLLIPVLIHGTYNFLWLWSIMTFENDLFASSFLILIVIMAVFLFLREKKMQKLGYLEKNIITFKNYNQMVVSVFLNFIFIIIFTTVFTYLFFNKI